MRKTTMLAAITVILLLMPSAARALPMAQIEIAGSGSGEIVGVPGETGGTPPIGCRYDGETAEQTGVCEAEAGEVAGTELVGIAVEHRELGSSEFGGWTIVEGAEVGGSCSGFSLGCGVISLGTSIKIRALFETGGVVKFHLLAKKAGTGDGTVVSHPAGIDCASGCASEGGDYPADEVVRLHATPDGESSFSGWRGCDAEPEGDCEVTMTAAREVEVEFDEAPKAKLGVIKRAHTEGGTVTSSPPGIDCGPTCRSEVAEFVEGEAITLTATAEEGYIFAGWVGCGRTRGAVCEIVPDCPVTKVGAVFARKGHGHRWRFVCRRSQTRHRPCAGLPNSQ